MKNDQKEKKQTKHKTTNKERYFKIKQHLLFTYFY